MTAFDPSDWLDRWEAAGGGWYVRDGQPVWCYLQGNEVVITALMIETYQIGRIAAIEVQMLARHAVKEQRQPVE